MANRDHLGKFTEAVDIEVSEPRPPKKKVRLVLSASLFKAGLS